MQRTERIGGIKETKSYPILSTEAEHIKTEGGVRFLPTFPKHSSIPAKQLFSSNNFMYIDILVTEFQFYLAGYTFMKQ